MSEEGVVRIERISIQNYRSCVDTDFRVQDDLSVLIGPNGSGKTNVLKAITLLHLLATERIGGNREEDFEPDKAKIRVEFLYNKRKIIYTAHLNLRADEENADVLLSADEKWYAAEITGEKKHYKVPLGFLGGINRWRFPLIVARPNQARPYSQGGLLFHILEDMNKELLEPLAAIFNYIMGLKYYSASQFTNPSACPVSFEVEKQGAQQRSMRIRGHGAFLYDLYMSRDSSGYHQFISVIGKEGIGLIDNIEFEEVQTSQNTYKVRTGGQIRRKTVETVLVVPRFIIGRNNLSPSQLSDGTFKTMVLLFHLMTRKSSLLLVEEPEVCVHHGLLGSIIELIMTYSKERQIIISTHSDYVLDRVEPRNVYRVSRDNNAGTSVLHLTKSMTTQDMRALKSYLDKEGNLGEYWRHGGLEELN